MENSKKSVRVAQKRNLWIFRGFFSIEIMNIRKKSVNQFVYLATCCLRVNENKRGYWANLIELFSSACSPVYWWFFDKLFWPQKKFSFRFNCSKIPFIILNISFRVRLVPLNKIHPNTHIVALTMLIYGTQKCQYTEEGSEQQFHTIPYNIPHYFTFIPLYSQQTI